MGCGIVATLLALGHIDSNIAYGENINNGQLELLTSYRIPGANIHIIEDTEYEIQYIVINGDNEGGIAVTPRLTNTETSKE